MLRSSYSRFKPEAVTGVTWTCHIHFCGCRGLMNLFFKEGEESVNIKAGWLCLGLSQGL